MSGLEPRIKSPERLDLVKVNSAGYTENGSIEVTVTYRYESWCCNGFHEVADAVQAVHQMMESSTERAYKKRVRKLEEDYKSLRGELDKDDHI